VSTPLAIELAYYDSSESDVIEYNGTLPITDSSTSWCPSSLTCKTTPANQSSSCEAPLGLDSNASGFYQVLFYAAAYINYWEASIQGIACNSSNVTNQTSCLTPAA